MTDEVGGSPPAGPSSGDGEGAGEDVVHRYGSIIGETVPELSPRAWEILLGTNGSSGRIKRADVYDAHRHARAFVGEQAATTSRSTKAALRQIERLSFAERLAALVVIDRWVACLRKGQRPAASEVIEMVKRDGTKASQRW